MDKLFEVIALLSEGVKLDVKYRDHDLVGNYKGAREWHIEPDWLLVYEYLLKHPFVEAEDIKKLVHVSKPTVNKILENLMDMEILELVEEKKRYRQYVYKKYVDILSEGTIL